MINRELIPSQTSKGSLSVSRRLQSFNKSQYFGVLATNNNGQPYTSLISFAMTPDMRKVIFATPQATRKFKNIVNTKKVSILIDNRSQLHKNLLGTEAITIMGAARCIPRGKIRNELAAIFLKKHPDLEQFVQAETTALIAVKATRCIHVGKFQTISVWDCKADA